MDQTTTSKIKHHEKQIIATYNFTIYGFLQRTGKNRFSETEFNEPVKNLISLQEKALEQIMWNIHSLFWWKIPTPHELKKLSKGTEKAATSYPAD